MTKAGQDLPSEHSAIDCEGVFTWSKAPDASARLCCYSRRHVHHCNTRANFLLPWFAMVETQLQQLPFHTRWRARWCNSTCREYVRLDLWHSVSLTLTAVEFLADVILVAGPLVMLWRVNFPPKERILILALLSSSVLTLLSTTVYCIFWFIRVDLGADTILLWSMTSQIEVCPSLSTQHTC